MAYDKIFSWLQSHRQMGGLFWEKSSFLGACATRLRNDPSHWAIVVLVSQILLQRFSVECDAKGSMKPLRIRYPRNTQTINAVSRPCLKSNCEN